MEAREIILDVRYILSDTTKDRWTDARLLSLLNDAIIDTAKNTTLFIENVFYVVQEMVGDIDLSAISTKIVRAEYLDEPLPFYTFDEADRKFGRLWQRDKGTEVKAIVYDKQKNGLLKQYPMLEDAERDYIQYVGGPFGIITDITYSDIAPVVISDYGDVGDIPDSGLIKFYYVRKHEKVTSVSTVLQIDPLLKTPFTHYMAGMALRDNQDTQNRNMGNEELKFYYAMLDEYSIQKSQQFVRSEHNSRYRPLG